MPSTFPSAFVIPAMFLSEPFGLASGVTLPASSQYVEYYLAVGFQSLQGGIVGIEIAFSVGDGYRKDIPSPASIREASGGSLDAQIHPLAPELQMVVAHQDPREQPCFAEDLKSVADSYD